MSNRSAFYFLLCIQIFIFPNSSTCYSEFQADAPFFPFDPIEPPSIRNCLCGGIPTDYPGHLITCVECQSQFHEHCMKWDADIAKENDVQFLCPLCRMKNLDPFFPVVRFKRPPANSEIFTLAIILVILG